MAPRTTKLLLLAWAILAPLLAQAQATAGFIDSRVVHGHSVNLGRPGSLKFVVGHRFGALNGGLYEFFGLDASTIRMSLDYCHKGRYSFGLGRSSYLKTFDGYMKVALLRQSGGKRDFPVSLTWMSNMTLSAMRWENPDRRNYFTSRLGYAHQLLVARNFGKRLAVQVSPLLIHRNIVPTNRDRHDIFALGTAARYGLNATLGLNLEYFLLFPGQLPDQYQSAVSLGFCVKTERHAFQVFVSNSRGMVERYIVTETTGDLAKGDLFLGFNISRDIQLTH